MQLGDLMQSPVYTCKPAARLDMAARDMETHNVGSLVVTDEADRILGILTDRDLALALGHGMGPATTVDEVMSTDVTTIAVDADVESAAALMDRKGVRHLPVVNDRKRPVGMIGLDDLYDYLGRATSALAAALRAQGTAKP
jgi:CBS domain-containing protein